MKKKKIFLSILLAVCLLFTLLPVNKITSFATESDVQEVTDVELETEEGIASNENGSDDVEELKSGEGVSENNENSEVYENDQENESSEQAEDGISEVTADIIDEEIEDEEIETGNENYSLKNNKVKENKLETDEKCKSDENENNNSDEKCTPDEDEKDYPKEKCTPNTRNLRVTKVWLDDFNRDGIRPKSVQVQLYQNGCKFGDEITLSAITAWTHIYRDLPIVDKKGIAYVYTVKEVTKVTGYFTAITADLTGYNIVNTHIPEKTKVSVSKVWDDNDDQDRIRPDSIEVQLKANGCPVGKPVTLSADNDWNYVWKLLPKNKCGKPITYTVEEKNVPVGYDDPVYTSVPNEKKTVCTITNQHTPEVISLDVSKKWVGDDAISDRPESITVVLLANGQETGVKIELTASDNWEGSFDGLSKYENGDIIEYTINEIEIEKYDSAISGDTENGYVITNTYRQSDQPDPEESEKPGDPNPDEPNKDPDPGNPPKEDVIPVTPTTPENPDSSTEIVYNEPTVTTENLDGQTNTDDETSIDDDSEKKTTETKDNEKTDTKKTESKKTGDTTPIGFFIILLAVSVLGIMWIFFGKEKRIGKHNK